MWLYFLLISTYIISLYLCCYIISTFTLLYFRGRYFTHCLLLCLSKHSWVSLQMCVPSEMSTIIRQSDYSHKYKWSHFIFFSNLLISCQKCFRNLTTWIYLMWWFDLGWRPICKGAKSVTQGMRSNTHQEL